MGHDGGDQDGSPGRILIVDDDRVVGRFLANLLGERGGFEIVYTTDPAVALQRASDEDWDLLLTDVEMPGMTGLELLKAARRIRPDLPVVMLTGNASVDYAVTALRDRADEFLQKTAPPGQILATVSAVVAKGRAARLAARQSILAIGAHPDDVEIGAAGVLAVHRDLGHEVSILTLSRGARGGEAARRAGESEAAARAIGATLYLDDLQDTHIAEGDPTITVISQVVQAVRPTVIYTHSLHDVHQDHRNTHRAAMVAARRVESVFCFQSPSATIDFRPTRFVNIEKQLDRKLQAIAAFGSQFQIRAYMAPDLIESTARYWSRFGGGRFAEAFEVIRDAVSTAGLDADPALAADIPAAVTAAKRDPRAAKLDPGAAEPGPAVRRTSLRPARQEVPHS